MIEGLNKERKTDGVSLTVILSEETGIWGGYWGPDMAFCCFRRRGRACGCGPLIWAGRLAVIFVFRLGYA